MADREWKATFQPGGHSEDNILHARTPRRCRKERRTRPPRLRDVPRRPPQGRHRVLHPGHRPLTGATIAILPTAPTPTAFSASTIAPSKTRTPPSPWTRCSPSATLAAAWALMGLERYPEAQEALEKAIHLDPSDEKARRHLKEARVCQIAAMGFARDRAAWALEKKGDNVEAAVEALCEPFSSKLDIRTEPSNPGGFRSLWVGNIQPAVTKKELTRLFAPFGVIHSIRILHDRYCAFVNYTDESSAARAMEELQGHSLCGASLEIRFPDRKLF
ncbi:hypothetical protein HPB48_017424 [Haemaphysalis longicornis]|uniref:Uncharacterized protein n=1 Tax=Haemaphysalis longicornis TaxID=44386 RepID=A0A9J6GA74_HAELO|nr:hypothetical protein HPB48_017424 [Haemaphysalis longicornis]